MVSRWAPPPQQVAFVNVGALGEFPLPEEAVRMEWRGPELDGELLLYDAIFVRAGPAGPELSVQRMFYGPDGYGQLGSGGVDPEGNVVDIALWDPALVVLPAEPVPGATWSGTHRMGDVAYERSCELLASDFCEGGLVSVCDRTGPERRMIVRDHFCPGVGWGGYEAMVIEDGKPPLRTWSEQFVRDGTRVGD